MTTDAQPFSTAWDKAIADGNETLIADFERVNAAITQAKDIMSAPKACDWEKEQCIHFNFFKVENELFNFCGDRNLYVPLAVDVDPIVKVLLPELKPRSGGKLKQLYNDSVHTPFAKLRNVGWSWASEWKLACLSVTADAIEQAIVAKGLDKQKSFCKGDWILADKLANLRRYLLTDSLDVAQQGALRSNPFLVRAKKTDSTSVDKLLDTRRKTRRSHQLPESNIDGIQKECMKAYYDREYPTWDAATRERNAILFKGPDGALAELDIRIEQKAKVQDLHRKLLDAVVDSDKIPHYSEKVAKIRADMQKCDAGRQARVALEQAINTADFSFWLLPYETQVVEYLLRVEAEIKEETSKLLLTKLEYLQVTMMMEDVSLVYSNAAEWKQLDTKKEKLYKYLQNYMEDGQADFFDDVERKVGSMPVVPQELNRVKELHSTFQRERGNSQNYNAYSKHKEDLNKTLNAHLWTWMGCKTGGQVGGATPKLNNLFWTWKKEVLYRNMYDKTKDSKPDDDGKVQLKKFEGPSIFDLLTTPGKELVLPAHKLFIGDKTLNAFPQSTELTYHQGFYFEEDEDEGRHAHIRDTKSTSAAFKGRDPLFHASTHPTCVDDKNVFARYNGPSTTAEDALPWLAWNADVAPLLFDKYVRDAASKYLEEDVLVADVTDFSNLFLREFLEKTGTYKWNRKGKRLPERNEKTVAPGRGPDVERLALKAEERITASTTASDHRRLEDAKETALIIRTMQKYLMSGPHAATAAVLHEITWLLRPALVSNVYTDGTHSRVYPEQFGKDFNYHYRYPDDQDYSKEAVKFYDGTDSEMTANMSLEELPHYLHSMTTDDEHFDQTAIRKAIEDKFPFKSGDEDATAEWFKVCLSLRPLEQPGEKVFVQLPYAGVFDARRDRNKHTVNYLMLARFYPEIFKEVTDLATEWFNASSFRHYGGGLMSEADIFGLDEDAGPPKDPVADLVNVGLLQLLDMSTQIFNTFGKRLRMQTWWQDNWHSEPVGLFMSELFPAHAMPDCIRVFWDDVAEVWSPFLVPPGGTAPMLYSFNCITGDWEPCFMGSNGEYSAVLPTAWTVLSNTTDENHL